MIRAILAILFVVLFLILSLPLMLVLMIIYAFNPAASEKAARPVIKWVFKSIYNICGVKVEARGTENIPENGAALFVANHLSIFDVVISYTFMKGPTCFISKKELKKVPLLAQWMHLIRALFLDRDHVKQAIGVIKTSAEYTQNGINVFVFPEGTRSKTGDVAEFKEGTFKIATRSNCPIIPVAITGTNNIVKGGKFPVIKKTQVSLEFLPAINPGDFDKEGKKHLGRLAHDRIQEAKGQA